MTDSIGLCIFGCGKLGRRAYSAMLKGAATVLTFSGISAASEPS